MSEPFIGEIKIFAGTFAPRGWAFCDGQLLPIAQNTALFSLVGTSYGGDGRTTLGLPNLQGRSPMHAGRGPGLTARRLGERGGAATHTLIQTQMPAHSHDAAAVSTEFDAVINTADTADPRGNLLANESTGFALDNTFNNAPPDVDMHVELFGDDIGNTGGSQAHSNRPPYLALNFIIALQGIYPSRS